MRHLFLERWSRRQSPIHRLDPRAKIPALLLFLIVLATAHRNLPVLSAGLFVLLAGVCLLARLPLFPALTRAAMVLPFTAAFAAFSWWAGDSARSLALLCKSYLSALAVITIVSTTPLPALIRGMEMTGCPGFLLMVAQFLYRYLFVISAEASHMRDASAARGGAAAGWTRDRGRFRAAAGALAVLFARSYGRAEQIHRAMLARGFEGHFRPLGQPRFRTADALFLVAAATLTIAWRIAVERLA